jgi:phage protein D
MPGAAADGPAFRITLNGSPIEGLLQASIVTSNCFSADHFGLTFGMGSAPLGDVAFWSSLSLSYVEIGVSTPNQENSQGLVSGMTDTVQIDPIQQIVTIEGRDLSSTMIDAYRQQDFVNRTASEVVSAIASYHGLTPVVTATSGSVGRYFGDGYTRLSLGQFSRLRSDWDLIVQLARENSFDVFVQGSCLYFQPSAAPGDTPVVITLGDVRSMRFERTLTIASNPAARVQSWNSQNMMSYDSNNSGDGGSTTQPASAANDRPFLFCASNFTSQQVTDSAMRYASELSRLGTVLHIEMPWDLTLAPRTTILINGTGSALDTTYQIDSVERHYSTISGSSQIIRAVAI